MSTFATVTRALSRRPVNALGRSSAASSRTRPVRRPVGRSAEFSRDTLALVRTHSPSSVYAVLGLQRLAGNSAVVELLARAPSSVSQGGVQRKACCAGCASGGSCESEEQQDGAEPSVRVNRQAAPAIEAGQRVGLTSPRFADDPILEACFRNEARLNTPAHGPAVEKVQQALIDLGFDLGPKGADSHYGPKTAQAVKDFKRKEHLGFEQFGDVGPGTMRRLNELFPGPLPPCPDPEPDIVIGGNDAASFLEEGGSSRLLLTFVAPGLLCKVGPTPTVIDKLADIPAPVRAKLRVDAAKVPQNEVDGAYPLFKGGVKQTATVSQNAIFGSSVPSNQDVKDGLKNVFQKLVSGSPPLGPFMTMTVAVNDAPGGGTKKADMPGGIFRFTRFQISKQQESVLFERLGQIPAAPKLGSIPGGFSPTQIAAMLRRGFSLKYGGVGYTLDSSWMDATEILTLDQALTRAGPAALLKAKGLSFDRNGTPTRGEDGVYDPNKHRIGIFRQAFASAATRFGSATQAEYTINHEIGHALSDMDSGAKAAFVAAAKADGAQEVGGKVTGAITDYAGTNFEEYFAEAFSMFTFDPGQLKALRPAIHGFFAGRY